MISGLRVGPRRRTAWLSCGALLIAVGLGLSVSGYALGQPPDARSAVSATPAAVGSPSPSAPPSPSPSPSPLVTPVPPDAVPATGTGTFSTAPGGSAAVGAGRIFRYHVQVEGGLGQDPAAVARQVETTFADPRGWTASGDRGFQRVPDGQPADFDLQLASPASTDRICAQYGIDTFGQVSCRGGTHVVINVRRWLLAIPAFADDVVEYRHLVVNHEVGHFLGYQHVACPRAGSPTPPMMTPYFGLHGCTPNAWPYLDGALVTGPPAVT